MDNSFEYNYCAKEQAEIKQIRDKYTPRPVKEESPLERLRRLDASVTKKGTVISLVLGVLGTLIMGTGMSLVMTPIAEALGALALVIGVLTGIVGILMVILAYPVYERITKKERERIAPEIIRLSDELIR